MDGHDDQNKDYDGENVSEDCNDDDHIAKVSHHFAPVVPGGQLLILLC